MAQPWVVDLPEKAAGKKNLWPICKRFVDTMDIQDRSMAAVDFPKNPLGSLKISYKRKPNRLPTIHFQVNSLLVQGSVYPFAKRP